jgi:hypothetical protein
MRNVNANTPLLSSSGPRIAGPAASHESERTRYRFYPIPLEPLRDRQHPAELVECGLDHLYRRNSEKLRQICGGQNLVYDDFTIVGHRNPGFQSGYPGVQHLAGPISDES